MSEEARFWCDPDAGDRYCPAFWEVRSERDDYRVLLGRLADSAERFILSASGDPAYLLAEIESARTTLGRTADSEPVKPAVIVFDINEGVQQWFDDLAEAVEQQSGGKVIISNPGVEMSDVVFTVADREVGPDEAVKIWHRQQDDDADPWANGIEEDVL